MYMYINSCLLLTLFIFEVMHCVPKHLDMFIVDIIIYMYHHKLNNFNMEIMFGITAYII